jgi:DNA-binding transcriptional regulator YiaG
VDEVLDFCVRVLGPGRLADEAAREAGREPADRMDGLAAAAQACRARAEHAGAQAPEVAETASKLAAAVARELTLATARLPERHREVLALREALGLSHAAMASVLGIEATAVPSLMARARLQLRAERRGAPIEGTGGPCDERERALRLLALRQDSEPMSGEDDEWLHAHMNSCRSCRRAHAAMLEASACYKAWEPQAAGSGSVTNCPEP